MYAQRQKWKVALVSESGAERGGLKECILQVGPTLTAGPRVPTLPSSPACVR